MRVTSKHVLAGIGLLILGAGIIYVGVRGKPEAATRPVRGNPVQAVKTVIAARKSIPVTVNANGYVTAINTVDVRPQVQSVVRAIHVKEGEEVRAGQLLFTLDDRNDAANVEKAKAQLARDRADLADAELGLKRNRELLGQRFVSQAVVDTARNKVESLRGTLEADIAALQASNVALSYNRIVAGIAGRIGAISVHPGSLAQPSGAPLVTIAQIDPITISFSVPQSELAHVTASYPKGDAPVTAQLPNSKEIAGTLVFIDNAIDPQTGTIRMKAQFPNRDHSLWPGAYANVRLVSRTLADAVVIPAQAIVTGPTEKFVYIVQPDATVKRQRIEVAVIENNQAAVTGLAAGARIVMEGAENLRPNSKVTEIDAQIVPADAAQGKKRSS